MSNKKLVILVVSLALVMVCMVSLTTAYLTSTSAPLENILEAGKTTVTEEEPEWDPKDPHPLLPGKVYAKDPTATLMAGSVPSYVFMEVTATPALRAILDGTAGEKGEVRYPSVNSDWTLIKGAEGDSTFVYAYTGTLLDGIEDVSEEDIQLPALFDEIKILGTATEEQLIAALGSASEDAETSISVVSKSCQKLGFATAAAAYETAFAPAPAPTTPPAEEPVAEN